MKRETLLCLLLAMLLGFASWIGATEPDAASPLTSYLYLDTLTDPPSQPNIVSPLVSYLYQDSLATPPGQPNVVSPLVSYLYQDSLATPPSQPNVVSPLVSYLYYDWPGDDNLTFNNSPLVSYLYHSYLGPVPALPTALPTTSLPPTSMVARPRVPSGTQLLVYTNGAFASGVSLDVNKMTIVLTHGWLSSSDAWPKDLANILTSQGFGATANIVAWDWRLNANLSPNLQISSSRTPSEGEALGGELLYLLGANYNRPIHFMGHSLGAMVNCRAADFIHGDAKNSPGKILGSTLKLNPQNTHMTMFDEAGAVGVANALSLVTYMLFLPTSGNTGDLINNFWTKVIPDHSAWIDNYVSEVGRVHPEAANALLWRKFSGPAGLHGYSYEWYSNTVSDPFVSAVGHGFSFERTTLSPPPPIGTYFLQSLDLIDSQLVLTPVDAAMANYLSNHRTLVYPTLQAYNGLNVTGNAINSGLNAAGHFYLDQIQHAGEFFYDFTESVLSHFDGQSAYVGTGTAGSTPAYIIPGNSAPFQSFWDLPFTLQKSTASPLALKGVKGPIPQPADADTDITNTAVYVWLPVIVPSNTVGMSFEFKIVGSGTNEYMTMGVSNENYFSMESQFMDDGVWASSGVIEISKYAGTQTHLFFSMNGDSSLPDGKLSVRGIQFFTAAPPTLKISVNGNQAVLSWPVITTGWQLEQTDTLSSSNEWTDVTNAPATLNYENTVTNTLSSGTKFFRLKK